MKVAIIGANGFVGTRLVEQFHLGQVQKVVPIVRRASALALPARFALDWRIADALDVAALTQALVGCNAVVHTALGDERQIAAMPGVLCAAAAAVGIRRVVYVSSASVHGQAPAPDTTEATPLHERHAMDYNNAKVKAERAFFRACARHDIAGFALRPGIVFGPRSRWIADLAADLRQRRAWLFNDGAGICNTIYVDNLVSAIAQCLTAPTTAVGAYLVGDAERVTWAQLYRATATALDCDPSAIHALTALPAFTRSRREKISRLVAGPTVQAVLPAVPSSLKTLVKRLLAPAAVGHDSWQLPAVAGPRITEELALLQQCRWALPSTLAAQQIGYQPPVSFATGLERSLAWLAYAEGRA